MSVEEPVPDGPAAAPADADGSGARVDDSVVRLRWSMTERDFVAAHAWVTRGRRRAAAALMSVALGAVALSLLAVPGPAMIASAWTAGVSVFFIVFVLWWQPRLAVRRQLRVSPESHPFAPQVLEASREGLVHGVAGWRNTLTWSAIQRIVVARNHVFLHLSGVQIVTVPRRAFGGVAAERRALAALRAWRRRAHVPELPDPEDEGLDAFVVRYVLTPEDYVRFGQAIQRRQIRTRPLLVLAGLGLLALLLFVGGPLSEGGVDLMTLVFFSAFAVMLSLLGVGPVWIPRLVTPLAIRFALWRDPSRLPSGDVDLRVGPAGGWSRSSRGLARFGWSDTTEVLDDEGVVALMFGPVTGVIVPDRALGEHRDAFVRRCVEWVERAPRGRRAVAGPAGPRRPPASEVPDPFAPPDRG